MSSSDSEDDCYGNIASKLQKMKNQYKEDKIDSSNLLNDSKEIDEIVKNAKTGAKSTVITRKKSSEASSSTSASISLDSTVELALEEMPLTSRRTRSNARKSKAPPVPIETPTPSVTNITNAASVSVQSTSRGRGQATRGRGQATRGNRNTTILDFMSPGRGRTRRRGRRRRITASNAMIAALQSMYPIYSVGNTHEYPDELEGQQLFSNPKKDEEVVVIEDNDPLDDNEELSVKVYWQSSEYFKFIIRRYQKLTQIFEYFAKKENVSFDNLLFTFNEKILKPDDTPESIDYRIVKFIDGGIVNKSVSQLVKYNYQEDVTNGINIKFQCQNMKKPFNISVGLDDKLSVAMMKCAEHLEVSLDKLRFVFDGDYLSAKNTPRELDFEGDECIDVKILS